MRFHGFSRFPKVSWEIWVSISSPPRVVCRPVWNEGVLAAFGRARPGRGVELDSIVRGMIATNVLSRFSRVPAPVMQYQGVAAGPAAYGRGPSVATGSGPMVQTKLRNPRNVDGVKRGRKRISDTLLTKQCLTHLEGRNHCFMHILVSKHGLGHWPLMKQCSGSRPLDGQRPGAPELGHAPAHGRGVG